MEYDDNYSTCKETDVTLRIFTDDMTPEDITKALGVKPSFVQVKGERRNKDRPESIINKTNGWFLSSEDEIISKDNRRHLAWLLEKIKDCHSEISELINKGVDIDIFCPWESEGNQGGPTMDPQQMKILGELNIELGFEFWYSEDKKAYNNCLHTDA